MAVSVKPTSVHAVYIMVGKGRRELPIREWLKEATRIGEHLDIDAGLVFPRIWKGTIYAEKDGPNWKTNSLVLDVDRFIKGVYAHQGVPYSTREKAECMPAYALAMRPSPEVTMTELVALLVAIGLVRVPTKEELP